MHMKRHNYPHLALRKVLGIVVLQGLLALKVAHAKHDGHACRHQRSRHQQLRVPINMKINRVWHAAPFHSRQAIKRIVKCNLCSKLATLPWHPAACTTPSKTYAACECETIAAADPSAAQRIRAIMLTFELPSDFRTSLWRRSPLRNAGNMARGQ